MIKIEEKYYKIWITLLKGVGIKTYIKLIKRFKNVKNIFNAKHSELKTIQFIDEKVIQNILGDNRVKLEEK